MKSKFPDIVFIAAGIVFFLPFIYLSFFTQPGIDDFLFSCVARDMGFLKAQWHWYQTWTGRYFAIALLSINPLVYGQAWAYSLIPVTVILLLIMSVYFFTSGLVDPLHFRIKLILTLIISGIYLLIMPGIAEGLYWMTGTIAYQLPNILTIFLAGVYIRIAKTVNPASKVLTGVCVILSIAITGSNETSMMYLLLLLIIAMMYQRPLKKPFAYLLAVIIAATLISAVISVTSPGNSVRLNLLQGKYRFIFSLSSSILYGTYYMLEWSLPVLIILLLSGRHLVNAAEKLHLNFSGNIFMRKHPVWMALIMMMGGFAGFFPGFWCLGERPPLRVLNVICFYFIIFSFLFFLSLINRYKVQTGKIFPLNYFSRMTLAAMLTGFLLFMPNNFRTALKDILQGAALRYKIEVEKRLADLTINRDDTCFAEPVYNRPATLFILDITPDAKSWRNAGLACYFHKKAVVLKRGCNMMGFP